MPFVYLLNLFFVTLSFLSSGNQVWAQTLSSGAGEFSFQDLPLGDYSITVQQPGFEAVHVTGVRVSAGAIYNLPVKLNVAQTMSAVEASAAAVTVETSTAAQTNVCRPGLQRISQSTDAQMIATAPGFSGYG